MFQTDIVYVGLNIQQLHEIPNTYVYVCIHIHIHIHIYLYKHIYIYIFITESDMLTKEFQLKAWSQGTCDLKALKAEGGSANSQISVQMCL